MAATQINSLNHRHQGVLEWLILNPDKPLGDCAKHLGYTLSWVSQIVHSDMFQARYKQLCEEAGQEAVHTINNQLKAATATALEKTIERLEGTPTERFLGETLKTTLEALGFSGGGHSQNGNGNGNQQHLHLHVDGALLVEARERALQLKSGTTQAKAIEVTAVEVLA